MRIPRVFDDLEKHLKHSKALVLYGPRQSGKTTILLEYLRSTKWKYRLDIGEDVRIQEVLGSGRPDRLMEYAEGYELVAIDEAQKVPRLGEGLKILIDCIPGIRIIVTGSSSFDLSGKVGETLTGRKNTLVLYPVAHLELVRLNNTFELKQMLEECLIFGGYPEVVTEDSRAGKIRIVEEIAGSYLLKDILDLNGVRSSRLLLDLLRLLAFQVGSEVSLRELATRLGIDSKTVARYLDLLEKGFVLFNLRGFSRNLRKEVTKKSKYYFYDNGIRNAVISNFNRLEQRDDTGALWENFLIIERLKRREYEGIHANSYFWRTWDRKEIDFVEEREGRLYGFEFKWGGRKIRAPKEWMETYPGSAFSVIDRDNYLDFILTP